MSSLIGFLVTLGVLSVSHSPEMEHAIEEPTAQVEQMTRQSADQLENRRERIQLTNSWLRSLRQVEARPPVPNPTLLAAKKDP